MKSNHKSIIISVISLLIVSSCSSEPLVNNTNIQKSSIDKNLDLNIRGKVEFTDFEKPQGFKIKNQGLISERATVSFIYPADDVDVTLRNTTIATGLSDAQGNFVINPNDNFSPKKNKVMILEASKRIGGAGNSSISLRTNIRWTGTKWESISSPDLTISKRTTALSIISSLSPDIMNSTESMNKVVYAHGIGNIIFDAKLTPSRFNAVYIEVEKLLADSKDPVENIFYLSPYTGSVNYSLNSYTSTLKSNMHTFKTIVETYAVDWGGVYPNSVETLEQEAKQKGYWKNFKNPFTFFKPIPTYLPLTMTKTEYEQVKSTLNYRGNTLTNKSQMMGIVVYEPIKNLIYNNYTTYFIYGVDINGNLLRTDPRDQNSEIFSLSNT